MKFTDWCKPTVSDECYWHMRSAWIVAQENERQRWVAKIQDEALADRVSKVCRDPGHDDRWCPTCEARAAGIEAYQQALLREQAYGGT